MLPGSTRHAFRTSGRTPLLVASAPSGDLFIYAKDLFVTASRLGRLVAGFDRSVVALAPVWDLLLCAKDLFVGASRAACPKNDGGVLRLRGLTALGRY